MHQAARKAFDALDVKKIPKVAERNAEYASLQPEKDALYPEYKKSRGEIRELLTVRKNVRRFLKLDTQPGKQNDRDRKNVKILNRKIVKS